MHISQARNRRPEAYSFQQNRVPRLTFAEKPLQLFRIDISIRVPY